MKKMLNFILAAILICGCKQEAPLTFQAGTYEVTTQGNNGDIVFDELIPQIIKANGTDVDALTGATVSSRALMKGVTEAANMAIDT